MDDPNIFRALGYLGGAIVVLVAFYYAICLGLEAWADYKERKILREYIKNTYIDLKPGGDNAPPR